VALSFELALIESFPLSMGPPAFLLVLLWS